MSSWTKLLQYHNAAVVQNVAAVKRDLATVKELAVKMRVLKKEIAQLTHEELVVRNYERAEAEFNKREAIRSQVERRKGYL